MSEDQAFKQVPWQNSPYLNTDSAEDVLSGEESPYWRDVQIETLPPDDENIWEDFGEVFSLKTKSQTFTPSVAESPAVLASQFHPGDSPPKGLVTDKLDDGNSVTQPIPSTSATHADGLTRPRSHELVTATAPLLFGGDGSKRQSPKRRHRRQRARLSKVATYNLDSLLLGENESDLSTDISNTQPEEGESEMSTNSVRDGRVCGLSDDGQTQWNAAEMEGGEFRQSQINAENSLTPEEQTPTQMPSIDSSINHSDLTGSQPTLSRVSHQHLLHEGDSRSGSKNELKEDDRYQKTPQERSQSPEIATNFHHRMTAELPQIAGEETDNERTVSGKDEADRHRGRLKNIVDILTCTSCRVTPSHP